MGWGAVLNSRLAQGSREGHHLPLLSQSCVGLAENLGIVPWTPNMRLILNVALEQGLHFLVSVSVS